MLCKEIRLKLRIPLKCTLESCLLFDSVQKGSHTSEQLNLLIAAKLLVAQKQKTEDVPTVHDWVQKCQYKLLMNKLTAIRKGDEGQVKAISNFEDMWMKFIEYWNQIRPVLEVWEINKYNVQLQTVICIGYLFW